MKNTMGILLLLLVVVTVGTGCGSATIDVWADRGQAGLINSQANIEEFAQRVQGFLDKRRADQIDAVFEDVLAAGTGKIEGVEIDAAWVEAQKRALLLLLELQKADQDNLDQAVADSLANLEQIGECFEQIKRLRRAWSPTEENAARLDYLTNLVAELIRERTNGR